VQSILSMVTLLVNPSRTLPGLLFGPDELLEESMTQLESVARRFLDDRWTSVERAYKNDISMNILARILSDFAVYSSRRCPVTVSESEISKLGQELKGLAKSRAIALRGRNEQAFKKFKC